MLSVLLIYGIFLLIAIIVICGMFFLATSAIIFSRVSFALAAAFVTNQNSGLILVPDNSFLSFVAWAMVYLGVLFLLASWPRIDRALKAMCTIFMSIFLIGILVLSVARIFAPALFQLSLTLEIIVKTVCVLITVAGMILRPKTIANDSPTNPILMNLERLFASAVYGIIVFFLFIPMSGSWRFSDGIYGCILIGSIVIAFLSDVFLTGKSFFCKENTEIHMPK